MSQKLPPFFYDVFDPSLPRLGPGDDPSTVRALMTILPLLPQGNHAELDVLDIGCGTGAQTIQLAKHIEGTITAIDNHQPFLDELMRRADAEGLADRIITRCDDMHTLGEKEHPRELIWAEGSLFVMGFIEGLAMCRDLLIPGGLLGVSELSWFTSDPPKDCRISFDTIYPSMRSVQENLVTIEQYGFRVLDWFALTESAWWVPYYKPLQERIERFRDRFSSDPERSALLDHLQLEIDLYRVYSAHYSNVFYLLQRRDF